VLAITTTSNIGDDLDEESLSDCLDYDYILSDEKEFEFLGEDEDKWIDNIHNNDELFYKELFT
jgi:hypothetical protein